MPHQLQVRPVVPGNIVNAVSKLLSLSEQLLEIAKATRHRFATGVDDPRVGQQQVNETDVSKIVWHLVDESRLAGNPIDAGVVQIFLAQSAKIIYVHFGQNSGVGAAVGLAAREVRGDPGYVSQ